MATLHAVARNSEAEMREPQLCEAALQGYGLEHLLLQLGGRQGAERGRMVFRMVSEQCLRMIYIGKCAGDMQVFSTFSDLDKIVMYVNVYDE